MIYDKALISRHRGHGKGLEKYFNCYHIGNRLYDLHVTSSYVQVISPSIYTKVRHGYLYQLAKSHTQTHKTITHPWGYVFSSVSSYLCTSHEPDPKVCPLGSGGSPFTNTSFPLVFSSTFARPVSPSCFAATSCFSPASPIKSTLGAAALPIVNKLATSACFMTLSWG